MKKIRMFTLCMAFAMLVGLCPTWVSAEAENTIKVTDAKATLVEDQSWETMKDGVDYEVELLATVMKGDAPANNTEVTLLLISNVESPAVKGSEISVTVTDEPDVETAFVYYIDQANTSEHIGTTDTDANKRQFKFRVTLPDTFDEETDWLYAFVGETESMKKEEKLMIDLPAMPRGVYGDGTDDITITGGTESPVNNTLVVGTEYTVTANYKDQDGNEIAAPKGTIDAANMKITVYQYADDYGWSKLNDTTKVVEGTQNKFTIQTANVKDPSFVQKIAIVVSAKAPGDEAFWSDQNQVAVISGLTLHRKSASKIVITQSENTAEIPVSTKYKEAGSKELTFKAEYKDDEDNQPQTDGVMKWSIDPSNVSGVSINESTGTVTITSEAAKSATTQFTITAADDGAMPGVTSATKTLTLSAPQKGVAKYLVANSADTPLSARIPTVDSSEGSTLDVKDYVTVYDAYSIALTEQPEITLTLEPQDQDVTAEGSVITVKNSAKQEQTYTVTVKASNCADITMTLKLTTEPAELNKITLSAQPPSPLTLLANGSVETTITASGTDQYGAAFTPTEIQWEIVEDHPSTITVSSNGGQTATFKADNSDNSLEAKTYTVKATSGGKEATIQIELQKEPSVLTTLELTIDPEVTVPPTDKTEVSITVAGKDQYGDDMSVSGGTTYQLLQGGEKKEDGISFEGDTMTIAKEARKYASEDGIDTQLTATNGVATGSTTFKLKTKPRVADVTTAKVQQNGKDVTTDPKTTVKVPLATASEDERLTLTATANDQYGDPINVDGSLIKLVDAPKGVSIANGVIVVTKEAAKAITDTDTNELAVWVKVTGSNEAEQTIYLTREAAKVTKATLESKPDGSIGIPTEGTTSVTYTAQALDQYDLPMDAGKFTFTTEPEQVTGVAFAAAEDGKTYTATVDSSAQAGEFTVKATSQSEAGVSAKLKTTLVLTQEPSKATSIRISAPSSIQAKASGNVTEELSATVYDQYGVKMDGAEVTWSVAKKVDGVSINSRGVVTVTSGAESGTFTVEASYGGITEPVDITIRRVKSTNNNSNSNNNNNGSYIIPTGGGTLPPSTPSNPSQPTLGGDVPADHWAKGAIDSLIEKGLITGDEGTGDVRPDSSISRQEIAIVLLRALGINPVESATIVEGDESSNWAAGYLRAAEAAGIMNGYDNGFLNGQWIATRGETIAMIGRALGIANGDVSILDQFADSASIPDWAKGVAATLVQNGQLKGYTDDTLKLENTITRAELFALIDRVIG